MKYLKLEYVKIISDIIKRNILYGYSKIFKRCKLEHYYLKVFEQMSKDNQHKPSKHWRRLFKNMKKEMIIYGLSNFKRGYANRHFANRQPKTTIELSAIWQYYNTIKSKDRLDILEKYPESKIGNPYQIEIDGKMYSWDYLQAIDEFYSIVDIFSIKPNEKSVICEIGAGYGRLAEVFLKVMPNCHYIIVDLPESLIISYYYLSKIFKNTCKYEDSRDIKLYEHEILSSRKVTFLLPNQFLRLAQESVDMFINIDSFQEMNAEIIKDYFKNILNLKGKYLYLKNSDAKHHNLVDTEHFNLIEYPKKLKLNIIKEQISIPYDDMVEQFIRLKNS